MTPEDLNYDEVSEGKPASVVDRNDVGVCPHGYGDDIKYEWKEAKRNWPQMTRRDRPGLLQYCTDLVIWKAAFAMIAEEGIEQPLENGGSKPSPYFIAYKELGTRLARFRNDIAASAGHRSRASDVKKTKEKKADEADQMLD